GGEKVMQQQLSLWDQPEPETLEFPFSWADGDTDLGQLQRLAGLLKQSRQAIPDDNGGGHTFQVISTRIADGKVYGTCVELPSINRVANPEEAEEVDE